MKITRNLFQSQVDHYTRNMVDDETRVKVLRKVGFINYIKDNLYEND